jgi:hypothetical protein
MDTDVLRSLNLGGDLEELARGPFRVGIRTGGWVFHGPQRDLLAAVLHGVFPRRPVARWRAKADSLPRSVSRNNGGAVLPPPLMTESSLRIRVTMRA